MTYLKPRIHPIDIAGRKFVLREMSGSRVEHYLTELADFSMDDLPGKTNTEEVNEKGRRFVQFICWLLDCFDEQYIIDNITTEMIWKMIEIQNQLNGIDQLLKKTKHLMSF